MPGNYRDVQMGHSIKYPRQVSKYSYDGGIFIPVCPECGNVTPDDKACEHCGALARSEEPVTKEVSEIDQQGRPVVQKERKSVLLATIASFVLPGLGQVYNGQLWKGLAFFAGARIVTFTELSIRSLPIGTAIITVICAIDAYLIAKRMNSGKMPFRETDAAALLGFVILWVAISYFTSIYFAYTAPSHFQGGGGFAYLP